MKRRRYRHRAGRRRRAPARAHQDRGAPVARRDRRRAGPPRGHRQRTRGDHPVSSPRTRAQARQARTGQRLRQDRVGRAGHAGCTAPGSRSSRPARRQRDPRRGRARHGGGGAHRVPRVPGRAGQDPAPARARRAARRHPQARAPRAARGPGHRAVRAAGEQPLPVHGDGRVRRDAGRVRRADRRRRPRHGAGVGEEPRQRGGGRRPAPLRLGAGERQGRRVHAGRPAGARRRAFRHTATYDVAVASYLGSVVAPRRRPVPRLGRRHLGAGAMLRYGENPHQAAALYASGAPAGSPTRSSCRARRCPTTTTSTPTPPGGPRTTSARPCVAIIKHANPCGIAVGADVAEAHRKAHASDPCARSAA